MSSQTQLSQGSNSWGQAVSLVNNALYIHGGKTNPDSGSTYNSGPTSNELLYLPLSTPFNASSPPWQLITNSAAPALSWHTLSAFNTSSLLMFGGDPGPNSPIVLHGLADSAILLNILSPLNPTWTTEAQFWANEPIRRIHHSASSTGGKIWLVGGVKDDGSGNAFSDHYVFDPNAPSFTQLPSDNGPPDLYGHASIVLSDGQMIIFGGYSQSKGVLIPFTTIWAMDTTQSSLTWTLLSISNSSLPQPRRAFAAVLLEGGKVLIHGGADAVLQNVFSDGWILDTTQNPMVWTAAGALSQVGPRYDHFAVAAGSQVMFGCGEFRHFLTNLSKADLSVGYGSNGPADNTLNIYDPSSGTFTPSFSLAPVSPTATLPVASQVQTQSQTQTVPVSSGTVPSGTAPSGTVSSTSQHSGESSARGSSAGSVGSSTGTIIASGSPTLTQGGPNTNNNSARKNRAATIAVATTFGVLALVAGSLATAYYVKRNRHYPAGERFHLLTGEDSEDGDGAHTPGVIPTAGLIPEKIPNRPGGWLSGNKNMSNQISSGSLLQDTRRQRRDMFADEDTREFGGRALYGVGGDGSAGSTWSLQSMGAAIGAGVRVILSRQNSEDVDSGQAPDPFLGNDVAAARTHNHRQTSYANTLHSYQDPFPDNPINEATGSDEGETDESTRLTVPDPMASRAAVPTITFAPLLPLIEQVSRTSDPTSLTSSQAPSSPFDSNASSSFTSYDHKPQRRSSIINSTAAADTSIHRSGSWWGRFARTSWLNRKMTEASPKPLDIRDPNPPPRLLTIQEASTQTNSPDITESQTQRSHVNYEHRQSMSSSQTALTADSEAIEQMGGMDVIQRVGTQGSQQTSPSTGRDSMEDLSWPISRPLSMVTSSGLNDRSHSQVEDARTVESPIYLMPSDLSWRDSTSDMTPAIQTSSTSQWPISSDGKVSSRIQAYERRVSQVSGPRSPFSPNSRNTRKREEHPSKNRVTVNYGLAPRPSLYVANPDHLANRSFES